MKRKGLILEPGPKGRCDDFRLGGAIVRHDPASLIWHMWYYCRDQSFDGPSTLGTGYIAYALSVDGINWNRQNGPETRGSVFAPSKSHDDFDSLHVGLTDISKPGDDWLMWYFGGDRTPQTLILGGKEQTIPGLGMCIGLARSADGKNWSRIRGAQKNSAHISNRSEAVYAGWPNIIHLNGQFILQYTSPEKDLGFFHTRIATSFDGTNWTTQGDIIWADEPSAHIAGGIVTRQVIENPIPGGRRFLMVFTAVDAHHNRSIAAAESDEGLIWHELYREPVFSVGEAGAWDCLGVAANSLVVRDGQIWFYYYGFQSLGNDNGARGIGLATCPAGDLRQLRRYRA